jgi:hypothetical protein
VLAVVLVLVEHLHCLLLLLVLLRHLFRLHRPRQTPIIGSVAISII